MKWIVEGANPQTGRELVREVEAETPQEAEAYARGRGLLVAGVRAVVEPLAYQAEHSGLPLKPQPAIPTKPGPSFICANPNCSYRGPSVRTKRGSDGIAFLLIMLGLVPGIIYIAFCCGHQDNCPECGLQVKL